MLNKVILLVTFLYGIDSSLPQFVQSQELTPEGMNHIFHKDLSHVSKHSTFMLSSSEEQAYQEHMRFAKFEAEGQTYNFSLLPSVRYVYEDFIPVWTVRSAPGQLPNYTYEKLNEDEARLNGMIFEDQENMATFRGYYENGLNLYDGVFSKGTINYVIRGVQEKWWKRPDLQENREYNHVMFKTFKEKDSEVTNYKIEYDVNDSEKLDQPLTTLYPKILPIVDYHLFKKLGKNVQETINYVATFWSAVDLMYSKLESPKIQLRLSGIIIAQDEHALNYVDRSRYENDTEKANPHLMLDLTRLYFHDHFYNDTNFKDYNLAVAMTGLNTGSIKGVAHIGKVCDNWYNSAVVKDDANYEGVGTAVHEIGHQLGLGHDGHGNAKDCPGYPSKDRVTIMAGFLVRANEVQWSECSKKELRHLATLKKAECLRRRIDED